MDVSTRTVLHLKHDISHPVGKSPLRQSYWESGSLYLKGRREDDEYLIGKEVVTSLGDLRHLKFMDLSANDFRGSQIPEFIGSLKQLSYLNLSTAGFFGVIPSHIRNLSNLKVLALGPSTYSYSYSYSYNTLMSDDISWISGLSLLKYLDLSYVDLSKAQNRDMVFYLMPSLETLSLSGWGLTNADLGALSHSSTTLANIKHLDLGRNHFKESFGSLTALTYLDLSNNELTGHIPTSLGRLVSLQLFSVYLNLLNGTITVSIEEFTKLRDLDISTNSLEGVINEAHIAKLSMLKNLDASHNSKLTFIVSREWKPLFQLISADLSISKIINGFPQWLRTQKKLRSLRLSNASITGPLPTWFQKMPFIGVLDLSHNKLSGPLTNLPNEGSVVDLSKASTLFLQDNLFNESILISLCRNDSVYLNLARNRLSGKLPTCLGLSWLNLNENHFTGELPQELENLRELNILDLGDNAFSGNIPEWIGENLTKLKVFRLHKNNFTGSIPRSLCNNSQLQILDVAHNNFMGPIPRCLGKLNGMITVSSSKIVDGDLRPDENLIQVMKGVSLEYTKNLRYVKNMDLSSNNLVGEIPVELRSLFGLVGLNLSNNHLNGGIPDNIRNMKELNSLDFSRNQLTGLIPLNIGALTFLSHLNLSHNNLSGRIPTGNQLQTLMDPSIYVGSRDLCGAPLPNECSNNEDQTTMHKNNKAANHKSNKVWFYMDIMCGFAAGFWGVIGVLLLKKHWRHKLFMFAEEPWTRYTLHWC
nr:leucine-rich repeat protein [Tanacetum cinerariifolium]